MSLILKRPVIVKHVVTEPFKQKTLADIDGTLDQIETNLAQIDFQGRQMVAELEKEDRHQATQMREELKRERVRQEQMRIELVAKKAQVESLQLETVFTSGSYDAPVQLEIGDTWSEKMSQIVIVVKDDTIIAMNVGT